MVTKPTFRTTDGTKWGAGQGSDLSATQVDTNFWDLYSALMALEDHQDTLASIVSANIVGNQLYFHLSNDAVLGPLTVPTAQWNAKGEWQPDFSYAAFDTISQNGSLYLVTVAHTSASTFNANATDGMGHQLYMLLLAQPANSLPTGGTVKQKLVKATGSPFVTEWEDDRVRLFCQVIGQPDPGEMVLQYPCVDFMKFPAGLAASVAYAGNAPVDGNSSWPLTVDGSPIGSLIFNTDGTTSVDFSADIDLIPGDVVRLFAPSPPDSVQADFSFVLVAIING